jgi:molecular chaperone DnaK
MPSLLPGPREGQREAVQARALLEKAERLIERVSEEDRAEVERQMERVRVALTDRKWDQLTAACNELADTLFYLEDV